MPTINRDGRKKRDLRNMLKRGNKWYFKKMVGDKLKSVSLGTDDLELAKAKRNALEQLALGEEWEKIKGPRGSKVGTLEEVFNQYELIGGVTDKAIRSNMSSMMTVLKTALGNDDLEASEVKLDKLTPKLVRDYQDAVRRRYEAAAGDDEKVKRMARDKADRTSKSTVNQAKCIFTETRQMVERYREKGIAVPDSIKEFYKTRAIGTMSTKVYFPPSDEMIKTTFERVEDLRASDPEAYFLFWTCLGTGCRRNELADMKIEDFIRIDGRLWVAAGLGKDGEVIQLPVIGWTVHAANVRTPHSVIEELIGERKAGFLFKGDKWERYDFMPDRLNGWLQRMGWNDEKKLHALRAFIGCKLYVDNPRLAQAYLRHKSVTTTEDYYSSFLRFHGAFKFKDAGNRQPAAPVTPVGAMPQPAANPVQASGQLVAS